MKWTTTKNYFNQTEYKLEGYDITITWRFNRNMKDDRILTVNGKVVLASDKLKELKEYTKRFI